MGILDAPGLAASTNRRSEKTGIYLPSDWGVNYRAKLASSATSLVKVAVVGDSISMGHWTSNPRTKSWPALLAASLQAKYGDGGSGYHSSSYSNTVASADGVPASAITAYLANNSYWAQTGTWQRYSGSTGGYNGPAGSTIRSQTAGSTVTIQGIRGTSIVVTTCGAGGANAGWTYSVDGGSTIAVADAAGGITVTKTSIAVSAGTHSIVITYNGDGTKWLYLCGVGGYNANGVVVDNYSQHGITLTKFGWIDSKLGPAPYSGGSLNPADLYVFTLGANDLNSSLATGVTLTSTATASSNTLPVSAQLTPGNYLIDSEMVIVSACTATTATLGGATTATHNSGVAVNTMTVSVDQMARIAARMLRDCRLSTNWPTDVVVFPPHIGTYDAFGSFYDYAHKLRNLADQYGAPFIDTWSVGRNSWDYWNSLNYFGTSVTPGVTGTDGIHLSDAGAAAYAAIITPLLLATN